MIRRPPAIGIDASGRWTAAAQVSVQQGRMRLDAAACVPRSRTGPADAAEMTRVAEVLDRRGFRGRDVVAGAPDDRLIVAALELPPRASGAPLEHLARVEVGRTHKRDPASLEVALWDAPAPARVAATAHYMAAALPHVDGDAIIAASRVSGLHVRAIDARAFAMARACAPLLSPGVWALLDLGDTGALLVVMSGGTVAFQRVLPDTGVEKLRAEMTGPLGMPPDVAEFVLAGGSGADTGGAPDAIAGVAADFVQEIAREVKPAVDYVAGAGPVEGLLLMGAGARTPGLAVGLGDALAVPVRVVAPADVTDCPAGLGDAVSDPRLTVAVGLSAYAAGGSPCGVDLTPAPRRRARARAGRVRVWAAAMSAWAAVLAGAYAWLAARTPAPEDWALQMTRAEQEGRVVAEDAARARVALAREQAARNAADAVEAQPDWSMLFAILARAAGDEIWLESATLKPIPAAGAVRSAAEPDRSLALDGMGRTQASVSRFVLALEETGLFTRVSLLETRRKPLAHGEAISFRVECRLGGEGAP